MQQLSTGVAESVVSSSDGTIGAGTQFAVGGVIAKAFAIFSRRLVPFVLLSAAFMLPSLILSLVFDTPSVLDANRSARGAAQTLNLVDTILQVLVQAVILKVALSDISAQPLSISDSVRQGLSRYRSLLGISIMQGVGMLIGGLLLIIPGLMLFAMWYVAPSVCMAEDIGAMDSLKRSTILTRGYRWKVFGLGFLLTLIFIVLVVVFDAIAQRIAGQAAAAVALYLLQAFYLPFSAVVGVVIYHGLRSAKEGLGTQRIATVFD